MEQAGVAVTGGLEAQPLLLRRKLNFSGTGILAVADIGTVFRPKRIHAQNNILNYLNLFRDRPV
ncbi:hypothetical protein QUB47_28120 [Microcoleus sp. AT9_B5]